MQRKRIPASFNKTGTLSFHDVMATKIKTLFLKTKFWVKDSKQFLQFLHQLIVCFDPGNNVTFTV